MKKQPFKLAYIDAFAGTGYQTLKDVDETSELMFPELAEEETQHFLEGSARIALQVQPRFAKYIFIEKKGKHIRELENLKDEFPQLANDITDLWILFPLGVAVNRLLKRDGNINTPVKKRLDDMFGTEDWYETFYKEITSEDFFGSQTTVRKVSSFGMIGDYFVNRLKTIFPGVAENPLPLYNSKGNPLYLLCFAASNPKGVKPALRIAQDILKK